MSTLQKVLIGVKLLSYTVWWVALGIATYVRWDASPGWDELIIGLPILCITFVIVSGLLTLKVKNYCTYGLRKFSCTFTPCFVLGILSFHQSPGIENHFLYKVTTWVLIGSLVLYIIAISANIQVSPEPHTIIHVTEISALAGLSLAIVVAEDHFDIGYLCSVLYIGLLLVGFHRKTIMPVMTVPLYVLLNYRTILQETPTMNLLNIIILLVLIPSESFVNVFRTISITPLDCWQTVYEKPLCLLRLFCVGIFVMEAATLVLVGMSLQNHKEWIAIIPLYALMAVFLWLPLHLVYFVTMWKLSSRIRRCIDIYKSDKSRLLAHVMSSRGLRHFSLIAYPMLWMNFVITLVQFIWSWTTMTSVTCGLIILCLPTQLLVISLLRELSVTLGGTITGCALITPSVLRRPNQENLNEAHVSSSYATRTLRLIQEFFNHHLIQDGGCDYFSDQMTEQKLFEKLTEFFSMRSRDGKPYDSYLLYYSGPVDEDGNWLLKGDKKFTYPQLMDLWMGLEQLTSSRLLLVLDTARSNYWVKHVRKTTAVYVGIQTLFVRKEAEAMQEFNIGDFTRDWVDFNCNKDSEVYSNGFTSPIVVTYGISPYWTNFRFQEPSEEDVHKHWHDSFGIKLKLLIQLYAVVEKRNILKYIGYIGKCVSMLRMLMWQPAQLDIGHGFKFLRYFHLPNGSSLF